MFQLFNRNKNTEPTAPEKPDFTEEQIQEVYAMAGGMDRYKKIVRWAKETMSDQYQDQFNEVINSGDVLKIKEQTESLIRKWDTAYEADPEGTEDIAGLTPSAELSLGLRDLIYKDERFSHTDLEDRIVAMKMLIFFVTEEHDLVLKENNLSDEQRTMFEVDLNKLKAALDIVRDV